MRRLLVSAAIALLFLVPSDATACQHDRDCPAASHCVLIWGQLEGICEHGVSPVAGQEVRRMGDGKGPRGGEGVPCEFTVDCAPGLTCVAQADSSVRVCRR